MNQRYHSLDNLRAIIMWLGVVLHVALNHMVGKSNVPWKDNETSQVADFIMLLIHTFRMPVFFILSGFFVAMLISRKGTRAMLINRAKRLALPFIIFWPILYICVISLTLMFISKINQGTMSLNRHLLPNFDGLSTVHLWFLYYLIWFCVLAACAHKLKTIIPTHLVSTLSNFFSVIASNWWGVIILTLPLAWIGHFHQYGLIPPNTMLLPDVFNLLHYGLYFAFGLFLFSKKDTLLSHYQNYCWQYLGTGFFIFILSIIQLKLAENGDFSEDYTPVLIAATYNSIGWIWSFALIGIFLRYINKHNRVLRYLSDSAYWVYLLHMVCTIGFGIILYDYNFHFAIKMLINIALTSSVCLATYHLFVRYSWLGNLLNGKRVPRQLSTP